MSKSIDEIIGSAAFEQVEKLKKEMGELTDKFDKSAKAATLLDRALSGAKTFKAVTDAVNSQKTALSEMDKTKAQMVRQSEKLAATQTLEAQMLKGITMAIQAENQATKDHIKLKQAQEGSLDQLRLKLKQLNAEYSALSAAERENSQAGKDMLANLQRTYTEITKLEQSMGNHTRNVGNYRNSMFSLTQVLRELPSFTYSAQTGFMGISNNLPMLADEFTKVKNAVNPATGAINGTMGALKVFGSSLLSFGNIFAIAIGLFTIFSKEIIDAAKGLFGLSKSQREFNEAISAGVKSSGAMVSELDRLYKAATNTSLGIDAQRKAALELQKTYPKTFSNFTAEEIAANKAATAYENLKNSILAAAKAEAVKGIIAKKTGEFLEADEKLARAMAEINKTQNNQFATNPDGSLRALTTTMGATQATALAAINVQREKLKKDFDKDIEGFTNRLNDFINASGGVETKDGVPKPDKVKIEAEKKTAKEKVKNAKDNTKDLKTIADKALQDEKDRLQLLADRSKRIADDEKADYWTRGVALEMFVDYKNQLIDLDKTNLERNEFEKLKIREDANDRINELGRQEQAELDAIERDKLDKLLKGYEAEKEKAIEGEKQKIDAVKQSYVEGKINKEQYEKEIAKISLESQIAQLEIALKYAEMQANLAGLPEDEKQKLLKRIKEIKDALLDAQVKMKDSFKSPSQEWAAQAAIDMQKWYDEVKPYLNEINNLSQSMYQREINDIERRAKAQDEAYSKEKEAIMNNGATAAANKVRLAQLDAKNEAEKRKFERERVAAERKRAIFQRGVDIAEIVAATAISALKGFATTGPIGAGAAIALGALQLAAVLAQPLPQYAKGRDGGPAEYAIVNEEGPELVRTKDGKSYIPNGGKRGVTFLPQGASVITNKDLVNMYKVSASDVTPKVTFVQDNTGLEQKLDTLIEINKNTKINQTLVFDSEYYSLVKRVVR